MIAQITNHVAAGALPDPSSPAAVGWACIIGVTIIVGLRQVMGFVRDMKKSDGPERRDVTITSASVSKTDYERHLAECREEHRGLYSKVGGVERGAQKALTDELTSLRQERRQDADKLQERLSGVDTAIGGLTESTKLQNQSLAQIQSVMMQVLQKVRGGKHE